VKNNFSKVT